MQMNEVDKLTERYLRYHLIIANSRAIHIQKSKKRLLFRLTEATKKSLLIMLSSACGTCILQRIRVSPLCKRRYHGHVTTRLFSGNVRSTQSAVGHRSSSYAVKGRVLQVTTMKSANFSSVSNTEIDKFSGMDQDWWDPQKNILIPMNVIRVNYIKTQCHRHFQKKSLQGLDALDIGCGGGLLSESLARLGAHVTGIDPSTSLVVAARQHAQLDARTRTINYRGGCSAEDLLLASSSASPPNFHVVCLLEVVEHAADVASLLRAASKLLRPDGILFVSTINRTLKSHLLTIVGAEYLMRYIPVGTHDWNKFLSPGEVEALVAGNGGLQQMDVSGMILTSPPICGSWNWKLDPNDTDVNWIGSYRKKTSDKGKHSEVTLE